MGQEKHTLNAYVREETTLFLFGFEPIGEKQKKKNERNKLKMFCSKLFVWFLN